LILVNVIVVSPSSSHKVLLPSQRGDSPVTDTDVGLAEIVKSAWPVTPLTVTICDALADITGEEESMTVNITVNIPAAE
jgi:hypothetical protein